MTGTRRHLPADRRSPERLMRISNEEELRCGRGTMQTPLVGRARLTNRRREEGFSDEPLGVQGWPRIGNSVQSCRHDPRKAELGSDGIHTELGGVARMSGVLNVVAVEFEFGVARKEENEDAESCDPPPRPDLPCCQRHFRPSGSLEPGKKVFVARRRPAPTA